MAEQRESGIDFETVIEGDGNVPCSMRLIWAFEIKARIKINERVHVLDEATRFRRQKKALEALEKDNFQDDVPQTRLISDFKVQLNRKLQQRFNLVDETNENNDEVSSMINTPQDSTEATSRKRKLKPESKLRFRKNFATLLEEEVLHLRI